MDIKPIWLKFGIIFGALSIILYLISYYVFPMGMWKQLLFGFTIMIVIMVLSAREYKREHDGILPYGEALKLTFLTGFTGSLIAGIFSIILINLVDPSIVDILKEQAIESTQAMLESFGAKEDVINEAMDEIENDFESRFTFTSQLLGNFTNAIFIVIIASIVSIFVKKDDGIS